MLKRFDRSKIKAKQQLPHDLVFYDILPRLPPKSVGRFRCVSKAWYSFLKNPEFVEIHLDHVTRKKNTQCQKLLVTSGWCSKPDFKTVDCEATPVGATRSDFALGDVRGVTVVGSCNGLVCIALWCWLCLEKLTNDLIVLNPLTGDHKRFEMTWSSRCSYDLWAFYYDLWAFYYDERVKDYKILNVCDEGKVFMFALKTNSWREVDVINRALPQATPYSPRKLGVFINGSIHWMANGNILRFDLSNENLKVEPLPIVEGGFFYKLVIHQECLHALFYNRLNKTELWRMNINKKEGWEKTTISVATTSRYQLDQDCLTSCGKLVVLDRTTNEGEWKSEFSAYNIGNRVIEYKFQIDHKYEISSVIAYTETLVSPSDIAS